MKKWLFLLLVGVLPKLSHASITDEGVTREKTVAIHFSTTVLKSNVSAGVTSSFVLISLSTPSGFPHLAVSPNDKREIDISHINIDIDKLTTSTGTVKIGVITAINTSTGCITFFYKKSFGINVSNTGISSVENLTSSFFRCRVNPSGQVAGSFPIKGLTPYIISSETNDNSSVYNSTGTSFNNPAELIIGNIVPMVGDIVMEVLNQDITNGLTVVVDLLYHAEAQ